MTNSVAPLLYKTLEPYYAGDDFFQWWHMTGDKSIGQIAGFMEMVLESDLGSFSPHRTLLDGEGPEYWWVLLDWVDHG